MNLLRSLFLTILLLQAASLESPACSCHGSPKLSESLQHSDLVCSGTVLSISYTSNYDSLGLELKNNHYVNKWPTFPIAIVFIKVNTLFKGDTSADTITILTPKHSATCGFHFENAGKYIIYGSVAEPILGLYQFKKGISNTYWTNLCSRTEQWDSEEDSAIRTWLKK